MKGDIYSRIEESFAQRTADSAQSLALWREYARAHPPRLDEETAEHADFPAEALGTRSGDLGFALMWIVQAVLVRSLIRELGDAAHRGRTDPAIMHALRSDGIGALAHSEDAGNPCMLVQRGDSLVLRGLKKYITGGTHCDFILLTARRAGESKVSSLIHLPASELPEGALEEISLPALRTTSHARLSLNEFTIHAGHLLPLSGPQLRRALRAWSIVERAFILRSYIALCVYMADRLPEFCGGAMRAGLGDLLSHQRALAADQARQAAGEARVPERSIDLSRLFDLVAPLRASLEGEREHIDPQLLARAPDLGLFDLIKTGSP